MKKAQDPGLGTNYSKSVKQLMNEDGSYNIRRIGAVTGFRDIYKYLIDAPVLKFALILVTGFVLINLVFSSIYLAIGVEEITGASDYDQPFAVAFYFSAQTLTTVGYGHLAPKGHLISIVAAFEAFVGLIGFAIATGVLYGRFSRPSSKIAFTRNVLFTDLNGSPALMFKMVNRRNNVLLNTKISVLISIQDKNSHPGSFLRDYYALNLEVDKVRYFPLTWTIVHIINEESPLFGLELKEIQQRQAEMLILLEAFDETFSQNIIQKHSYAADRWLEGYRFKRNFRANDDGKIELNIHELDDLEPIETAPRKNHELEAEVVPENSEDD